MPGGTPGRCAIGLISSCNCSYCFAEHSNLVGLVASPRLGPSDETGFERVATKERAIAATDLLRSASNLAIACTAM